LGKQIGFEKISFKRSVLRGFFTTNKQSPYFETEQFVGVLQFVQAHPKLCNLKEVKNTLRLSIDHVNSVEEAILILQKIACSDKEYHTGSK
jgi:transcription-repair coupling factor (superfamily II helicase)